MSVYYNEIDPRAAATLRELIAAGAIAPGDVDERSVQDVRPVDLVGYRQCHFFAGGGVWSYASRLAGIADDARIWTMSCPCQPFSQAGKGAGFDDERHLWPDAHWLVQQCQPDVVLGEQVASLDGLAWFDTVHADMDNTGYTGGALDLCAAGFGAPHIRQRLFFAYFRRGVGRILGAATGWLGDPESRRCRIGWDEARTGESGYVDSTSGLLGRMGDSRTTRLPSRERETVEGTRWRKKGRATEQSGCTPGGLADTDGRDTCAEREQPCWQQRFHTQDRGVVREGHQGARAGAVGLANADRRQRDGFAIMRGNERYRQDAGRQEGFNVSESRSDVCRPGPTNGFWSAADWLGCRDGKWRPVEPGTFPLAHGAAERVGRLRLYGNAIVAPVAAAFIETVMNGR